jgi:AsmA-like protein
MNRTTVFSKTGKGLLEIKNKSNRLSKDQFRVLNLVDGKATLDDLVDKGRISEVELRKVLSALSDGGFIKEFTNPAASGDYTSVTIPPVPPSTSYVDDLDFTQILGPSKPTKPGFYQSAQTEQRQREEAERKASEAAASKAREEAEKRAKDEAARRAREDEMARRIREDAERKAKEEQARREKLEAEMRYRLEEPKRAKEEAERRVREKLEAEKRAKEEAERKVREEAERRAKIQAEAAARVEAERKRKEEEERRRREEEERRRREEEERKRREEEERRRQEEERKRKEEEERRRREEEERRRREEEERKRREEEERKRREAEERKRREDEERKRKEEEERKRREEEERKRKEEEERKRREEEERKRKEEEERKRKEEEERRRKEEAERLRRELEERHRREQEDLLRRLEKGLPSEEEERKQREVEERRRQEQQRRDEEEERYRREEEARKRREEDERARKDQEERQRREEERTRPERDEDSSWSPLPTLEVTTAPEPAISSGLDSDLDALKRAEAEVEKEFMAKEEAIRMALEEQERRFRLEEEARAAMDRAERETREKADQEARELAAAAERARREAEQRAREEGVRRQQEEKERRAKDQEERKKKGEEERKKRERDRREQEQRAREEALAQKRAEQQELDRKKSERERLAREAKKRAWGPGRISLIAAIALITLIIGGIQVAPLSAYAPEMEKLAAERIGEPVRIGAVHASLFPGFHLKLENVTIGQQQDVRVPIVTAYMDIGSVLGGEKLIKSLELDQLQANQEVLGRLPGWLANTSGTVKVRKILLRGAKVEVKGAAIPTFNAQVFLAPDGTVTRAMLDTLDGHFGAELLIVGSGAEISARVKNFSLPFGPPFEVTEGTAKGMLSGNQIRLSEMDLYLYGGQAKGQAGVSWGSPWNLEGDFELKRVDLEAAMKALKIDIASEGLLDAKGRYALQANSLPTLFDNPRVEATFNAQKGALSSFDFVRALQTPARDGVQGGKTKFDELSGSLSMSGGRYTYSNARLRAGLLSASGACEVLPTREINGRAYVELRSSSNVVKNTFKITGTLKAIVLKP